MSLEKTTVDSDVPTALPGFEDDEAREKLLLETSSDHSHDVIEDENEDAEEPAVKPNKRRWQILRTFGAFALFICLMVIGIAWFFGMGWFSNPRPQVVNRNQNDDQTSAPATEDEKLKIALSMIAPPPAASVTAMRPAGSSVPADITQTGIPAGKSDVDGTNPRTGPDQGTQVSIGAKESYSLTQTDIGLPSRRAPVNTSKVVGAGNEAESLPRSKDADSDEARGRSSFFGITKNSSAKDDKVRSSEPDAPQPTSPTVPSPARIPFGTMLPVRLIGSVFTLRNSGGVVRMELTRPVEGKGYSYPAGTIIVGTVRGGESIRAFVNVVGLIDPVSGDLVRFSGELLGRDGASGIEGKLRNLTSQWSRFFRGMKDTAASVLGSVGAIRSGSTVILSEPLRRGSESMTEDLSGALLKTEREDSFLEVAAGSNGYVLVVGLPEDSASTVGKRTSEAGKE